MSVFLLLALILFAALQGAVIFVTARFGLRLMRSSRWFEKVIAMMLSYFGWTILTLAGYMLLGGEGGLLDGFGFVLILCLTALVSSSVYSAIWVLCPSKDAGEPGVTDFRNIASVLALAFFGWTVSPLAARAATYTNVRFGYSISYPDDLVPEREADNGDGRIFHARRGTAKLSVWGSFRNGDLEGTPDAIADQYLTDCGAGKITYKLVKPRLVAFSCVTLAGKVIYQKTLIGADDVLRSLRFEYLHSDRAAWDPVVRRVSGSLRPGVAAN